MVVEACMNPELTLEDSDDDVDEPLAFRRKPNPGSTGLSNSSLSSVKPERKPGKRSLSVGTPNVQNLSDLKEKAIQKSKPSSSKASMVTKKSPPPCSGLSPSPPPLKASFVTPLVNGASLANHELKKETVNHVRISVEEGEGRPIVVKEENYEDSDDDKPLSARLGVGPQKGNAKLADGEVKLSESDSEDSDDEKPLSSRLDKGRASNGLLKKRTLKANVKSSEDYDDKKQLSSRYQKKSNAGTSSSKYDGSNEHKPLATGTQNGSIKRENPNQGPFKSTKKVKLSDASTSAKGKQISRETEATGDDDDDDDDEDKLLGTKIQNGSIKRENPNKLSVKSTKKVKLSDASTSAKGKQISRETEAKDDDDDDEEEEDADDDDDDDTPIAHRLNKASSSSSRKSMFAKKKIAQVHSSQIKKVNKKSKKITKKSRYARSSKELPSSGSVQKWTSLVHNGVKFPPPYQPHGVKMLYDCKPVNLTPEQEEVATMYAVMLETDYVTKDIFNENFFNDWKTLLGENHVIQEFFKCDFRPIHEWHLREKEKQKLRSKAEKKALSEEKKKVDEKYMWAIVDGVKEKVGNFTVEPPRLFRGRGKHPQVGRLKPRIYPKDITINIGKDAPIPESPIPDQSWKEIRHDNTVTWLAYWKDPSDPKSFKYVNLGASSTLKGLSDKEKYEKARKLKDYIEGIRMAYKKDFSSKDITRRQIAVATYLIDRLALRAGNEKDDDEADTVGCCTLKVENVKTIPPNILEFDFLGKDSIKYYKQFEAEPLAYKAVEHFRQRKSGGDDLFDRLDTNKLNAHLKGLMPSLTAKVFRTFNASFTLDNMLAQGAGSGEVPEKIAIYQHANKEVAIICNHQRAVSKSHSAQMERLTTKINKLKAELSNLETDLAGAKKGKSPLKDHDGKQKRNMIPDTIEKKMNTMKTKIEKLERDKQSKEDLKEIALGTSRINYLDPRITVAWCKRNEVPIEKLFNKSLLAKFAWAMETEPDFRF